MYVCILPQCIIIFLSSLSRKQQLMSYCPINLSNAEDHQFFCCINTPTSRFESLMSYFVKLLRRCKVVFFGGWGEGEGSFLFFAFVLNLRGIFSHSYLLKPLQRAHEKKDYRDVLFVC